MSRPSLAEINSSKLNDIAKQWGNPKPNASAVVSKLYRVIRDSGFAPKTLLTLEYLQCLEILLWPHFNVKSKDDHVIAIALMKTVKHQESVLTWDQDPELLGLLFSRVLSLVSTSKDIQVRSRLLSFISLSFHYLDSKVIRKQLGPLVSVSIWASLSEELRDSLLEQYPSLTKAWKSSKSKFNKASKESRARLLFERSWLYNMIIDLLHLLASASSTSSSSYIALFLEFLITILSQLPTRRFTNTLLKDLHLIIALRLSDIYKESRNIQELAELLEYFMYFPLDDFSGEPLDPDAVWNSHAADLVHFQRLAYREYKPQLQLLALSNFSAIDNPEGLTENVEGLSDEELKQLCQKLAIRTDYQGTDLKVNRAFLVDCLIEKFRRRISLPDSCLDLDSMPTETVLYSSLLYESSSFDYSRPLPQHRLGLQYLSVTDFLVRSFHLQRAEAFYQLRSDLEDVISRLKPGRPSSSTEETSVPIRPFYGQSRMAAPITSLSVLEVSPPKVGTSFPAYVRIEVSIDLRRTRNAIRDWSSLRQGDVVILMYLNTVDPQSSKPWEVNGLYSLRGGEIVQVLNSYDKVISSDLARDMELDEDEKPFLKLHINMDARNWAKDESIYPSFNVVVRRRQQENNFKPILDTVRNLTQDSVVLPDWLADVFLGFGDPSSASFGSFYNPGKIDLDDTFLDLTHLRESFPAAVIEDAEVGKEDAMEGVEQVATISKPPFVLDFTSDSNHLSALSFSGVKVSTYTPANTGPYPSDMKKLNGIRFTPAQVDAIIRGSCPGLTVVVGPPGTGKTDVAVQILHNIYHNFPDQRTLVIAHSNQALNHIFEKVMALDIDEKHLLRLGHGEEQISADARLKAAQDDSASFSRYGRVESFLQSRGPLLKEVDRLAASLGIPGAHGDSCETAGYFYEVFIQPLLHNFESTYSASVSTGLQDALRQFPFHSYFSDIPNLFPAESSAEDISDIIQGCFYHISKLFSDINDIRPFEVIRNNREKANYLLVNKARIVAMTATHAGIQRGEIVNQGFNYDNVVVEEASQLTQLESFIPLTLQKSSRLKRVVLIGDHLQNTPVVQNKGLSQYSNLDQSLFERLVRLGVPHVMLDKQGRARPEIAELYGWRYGEKGLGNLERVTGNDDKNPEYSFANAGFLRTFQFINIEDHEGQGESSPSPHFIQNVGEAEYSVALYQYMRLLGYQREKITILTAYQGQKVLIEEILQQRCSQPLFGIPKVSTVDRYQGEQNDFIIVSLVRTKDIGYLRDIRRLTVALSRARLGMYVLGRYQLLQSCVDLQEMIQRLCSEPSDHDLWIVTGELYGQITRKPADTVEGVRMQGLAHFGQYVFEMTNQRYDYERRSLANDKPHE